MRFASRTLIVLLATSCSPTPNQAPNEGPPLENAVNPPPAMQSLDSSLQNYYRYSSGLSDSARLVIRDAQAWSELWIRIVENHEPAPATPQVDFSREMLIVAAMGTRSSGGHSIAITGVTTDAAGVTVTVMGRKPGPTCMTTMALTAPVDIVRIPRTDLPVRFVEQLSVSSCGP